MTERSFCITREKHLDHMVRVVPFIVCGYLMQCYLIIHMNLAGFATDGLLFLGFCLGGMIAGFITYDLKHKVNFNENSFEISWLGKTEIAYTDVMTVEVSDEEQSFANLTIVCKNSKKYTIYFVDEADKIKSWLKDRKHPASKIAA